MLKCKNDRYFTIICDTCLKEYETKEHRHLFVTMPKSWLKQVTKSSESKEAYVISTKHYCADCRGNREELVIVNSNYPLDKEAKNVLQ